ncbi:MAG: hypothetical protein DMF11_08145 [Verrucomicrobia bacterium]|nr:MAG: hypothetical protein DMF11_08145 [Verrucomicrobiota bacterium]
MREISGSALVASAGEGVTPSRTSHVISASELGQLVKKSSSPRDTATSTRDARATQAGAASIAV